MTQTGNYSHGYIGAEGNKEDTYKRGYEQDQKLAVGSTLFIRPGVISTLYTHRDNTSAVPKLHFLASWTSFCRKRKSTRVFKRKNFARDQH